MAENTDVPENADANPDENEQTSVDADATPAAPAVDDPAFAAAVAAAVAAASPARPRLRDRVWSFRAMVAVGVATLLLGGAGGAALVAATSDDDHGRQVRMGRPFDGPGGQFGQRGPGGQGAPQLQQNGQQNGQTG